jgi:hypothetical protein
MSTHPKTGHHLVLVNTKLLAVTRSKLADCEGPAVETRAESDGALVWVDLDITESLVIVGGNDDVDRLDDTREVLVQILLLELEFEERTIDLVDDDDWLDALTKSLSKHSLSLHAHTFDSIDDDESTVSDTESCRDLRREIDVTGRVNQVDQEVVLLGLDWNVLEVLLVLEGGVQRDGGRLDGDTTFLLVGTGIGEAGLTSLCGRNDTGTLDEGVGEGGLAVIDCRIVLVKVLYRCDAWSSKESDGGRRALPVKAVAAVADHPRRTQYA